VQLRHLLAERALIAACVVASATALAQEPTFSGGDGSSCEEAVVPSASDGMALVQAEQHWLRKTFGGGSLVRQALGASSDGKRRYDLILWRKPDGQTVDVCFDVTTVFEETIRRMEELEKEGK
jgi:hypothetical protein